MLVPLIGKISKIVPTIFNRHMQETIFQNSFFYEAYTGVANLKKIDPINRRPNSPLALPQHPQ